MIFFILFLPIHFLLKFETNFLFEGGGGSVTLRAITSSLPKGANFFK